MEGDADDFVVLEDGAAGVTGVDGGIDLDDEVRIGAAVGVGLEIDAGDDAFGDGEAVAADGVADDGDLGFEDGNLAEGEDGEVFEGCEVIKGEEGEVAIVGDVFDFCGVFFRAAVDGDQDALLVGYDVCVGEDFIFTDDEACADATAEASGVPWGVVVGCLRGDFDAEDGAVEIGGAVLLQFLGKERGGDSQEGEDEEWEAGHMRGV